MGDSADSIEWLVADYSLLSESDEGGLEECLKAKPDYHEGELINVTPLDVLFVVGHTNLHNIVKEDK